MGSVQKINFTTGINEEVLEFIRNISKKRKWEQGKQNF